MRRHPDLGTAIRDQFPGKEVTMPKQSKISSKKSQDAASKAPVPRFDARMFLTSVGAGRSTRNYRARRTISRQGDTANAVFYVQAGDVRLTVMSRQGKQAVVASLKAGDFFGEGSLTGQRFYLTSAVASSDCAIARIELDTMIGVLRDEPKLAEMFLAFLLARNVKIESDLIDQLFNSSEKRLARVLLQLADFSNGNKLQTIVPRISQDVLAATVGTTRPRINLFMNKFRKLGFIEYDSGKFNDGLNVHSSLMNVIIDD
jgi:CRP/FNR family transcriptional regulator, cyclic AMP receptor protein